MKKLYPRGFRAHLLCSPKFIIALFSFCLFNLCANAQMVTLGQLTDYLFVFTNGSVDANWQSASKGFIGDVAINGDKAKERTSGSFGFSGKIYTNSANLGAYQQIVNNNNGQAFAKCNQAARLSNLENDLTAAFAQINALPVSPGYQGINSTALDGLNTMNGMMETFVINVTSGFSINSTIDITGDANDLFILRWDTDQDFSNGYNGKVKFSSGGGIIPHGNLMPTNFIHVAGDIGSSGGGNTPALPYPQGPRKNNGTGSLINGGSDFHGGGFFTGYWLTKGDPATGQTSSLSNAIFAGGWYSSTTKFSMTSGTSGIHLAAPSGISAFFLFSRSGYNDPQESIVANPVVRIYPNPVSSRFTIIVPDNWQNKNIIAHIAGLNGAIIRTMEISNASRMQQADISSLPPGIYLIKIDCDGVTITEKIVKQ